MFAFERFMGIGEPGATFSVQLRCFSAPFFPKYDTRKINELNYGGKILLPNSCLDSLVRRNIQWPMLFKLTNPSPEHQKATHAGVLEFLAEEGKCYLPSWMMNQLMMLEGGLLVVEYRSLPPATYAKFKPMSTDFYHVTNPKAMLEVELRKFACLTKNDVIAVQYNEQIFEFKVIDLKPQPAVTIIECDINIEFEEAVGYVEPTRPDTAALPDPTTESDAGTQIEGPSAGWKPFTGVGQRLDGKKGRTSSTSLSGMQKLDEKPTSSTALAQRTSTATSSQSSNAVQQSLLSAPIVVDENYTPGTLTFVRTNYKSRAVLQKLAAEDGKEADGVKPFSGKGQTIRGGH